MVSTIERSSQSHPCFTATPALVDRAEPDQLDRLTAGQERSIAITAHVRWCRAHITRSVTTTAHVRWCRAGTPAPNAYRHHG